MLELGAVRRIPSVALSRIGPHRSRSDRLTDATCRRFHDVDPKPPLERPVANLAIAIELRLLRRTVNAITGADGVP
jgi:hypothetical protein